MAHCDAEDNVWLIDDGGHVLYHCAPDGRLFTILRTKGVRDMDGTHFNQPTDLAYGVNDRIYVSDRYWNKRVAYFDRHFTFLVQWGSEGEGPGQFVLPHAITVDDNGLVYVADRTKWRIQIFTSEGAFLRQWTHIDKPFDIVYAGDGYFYICNGQNARMTKVDARRNHHRLLRRPWTRPRPALLHSRPRCGAKWRHRDRAPGWPCPTLPLQLALVAH